MQCIPLRSQCSEFLSDFYFLALASFFHVHMAQINSTVCDPKTTAFCSMGDKEKGRVWLSPAGEDWLWFTEEQSQWKACLTEPVCLTLLLDDPQRDWCEEKKIFLGTAWSWDAPTSAPELDLLLRAGGETEALRWKTEPAIWSLLKKYNMLCEDRSMVTFWEVPKKRLTNFSEM